jgi:toxin ParE1/3/4
MPGYKLTTGAKEDIRKISEYTKKTWGKEQEKAYRESLRIAFGAFAKTPKIGKCRDELAEGLRSFFVGQHVAYYIEKADGIVIVRILHQAMDSEKAMKQ